MTGLRRDEAPTRANAPIVGLDVGRGIVKVNPIAPWTDDDVDGYIADHEPARAPARATRATRRSAAGRARDPVADGEDPRAGRWAGQRQDRVRPPRLDAVGSPLERPRGRGDRVRHRSRRLRTGRPTYPADAVAWLVDALHVQSRSASSPTSPPAPASSPGCSRRPARRSSRSSRSTGMRALLRATVPRRARVAATAEALPFATASLDAITVAQAFHWFDAAARARGVPARAAPGRPARRWCGTRVTASVPWVDRGLVDHGPGREARAVARPRRMARVGVRGDRRGSARCTRRRSTTSRCSRPTTSSNACAA